MATTTKNKTIETALKKLQEATTVQPYFTEDLTAEGALQVLSFFELKNREDLAHKSVFKEDKVGIYLSEDNVIIIEDVLTPFLNDETAAVAVEKEEARGSYTNTGWLVEKAIITELQEIAGDEANDIVTTAGRHPRVKR